MRENQQKKSTQKWIISLIFTVLLVTNIPIHLTTANPADPWYNTAWTYRKEIHVDHTKVAATLTNYPLLFHRHDSSLAAYAQDDGDDILFTTKTGTKLSHELEYFNGGTGEITAWVNIPSISPTVDTVLYIYYGNPNAANQESIHDTWDDNYLAVHHLAELSGTAYDSTDNNNDATPYGGMDQSVTGKIGDADAFDGSNDQLRLTQIFTTQTHFSIETWIYAQSEARIFFAQRDSTQGVYLQVNSAGNQINAYLAGTSLSNSCTLNTWMHIVLTYNGTTARLYRNGGTPTQKTLTSLTWPNLVTCIGGRIQGGLAFRGGIDEFRISTSTRSSAWITTEYRNQNSPETFNLVGSQEHIPQSQISFTSVYPSNVYTTYNPRLKATINGGGGLLTVTFRTNASGSWQTIGTYQGYSGVYAQNTTGMIQNNRKCYWQLSVTDGNSWKNQTYVFIGQPFRAKWQYNLGVTQTVGPQAADINNDGSYELFVIGEDKIACLNANTGVPLWVYTNGFINYHSQFEIADLNNDNKPEVVLSAGTRTIALHANDGTVYWNVPVQSYNKNVLIVDLDGNHYPYVFVAFDDVNTSTGRLRKLKGTTGQILDEVFAWRPCYGSLSCADADNDGNFEIYMTDRAYDYEPPSLGKGMQAYDADTLDLLWYEDKVTCSSQCMMLIDVNEDGVLDSVALDQSHNHSGIYTIDGTTWEKMPGKWITRVENLSAHSSATIHDVDGDGNLELLSCRNNSTMVWDMGLWQIDAILGFFYEPPKLGNIIGDSRLEIIGAKNGVQVYDSNYTLIQTIATSALTFNCVQDIDNDWQNEIIFASTPGLIRAYDTSGYTCSPKPRSESEYYSERRTGEPIYIPPPGAPQPIIKQVSPTNNSQDLNANPQICVRVIDYQYNPLTITITTNASGQWQTIKSYQNVANGWYNFTPSVFTQPHTSYYWKVTARDPTGNNLTTQQTYTFTTQTAPIIEDISAPDTIPLGEPINISCIITDNDRVQSVKVEITAPDGQKQNLTSTGLAPAIDLIAYDDFEDGWGNYTDGGKDCTRIMEDAHQGDWAIKIRNFTDSEASAILTNGFPGASRRYDQIKTQFWYLNNSMLYRENFFVKYWDGRHWRIVKSFISSEDFTDNTTYNHATVLINRSTLPFRDDMKIRFQCDAGSEDGIITIDQITITATTHLIDHYYLERIFAQPGEYSFVVWAQDYAGNRVHSTPQTFHVT